MLGQEAFFEVLPAEAGGPVLIRYSAAYVIIQASDLRVNSANLCHIADPVVWHIRHICGCL